MSIRDMRENLARRELIGLHAKVVSSRHKGYVNIEGPIIMESRNMIDIAVGNSSLKRIPKKSVTLELSIPDNCKVRIDGIAIVGRPENRIKMKRRKNHQITPMAEKSIDAKVFCRKDFVLRF